MDYEGRSGISSRSWYIKLALLPPISNQSTLQFRHSLCVRCLCCWWTHYTKRDLELNIERQATALNTSFQEIQEPWLLALSLGAKQCHGCEIPSTAVTPSRTTGWSTTCIGRRFTVFCISPALSQPLTVKLSTPKQTRLLHAFSYQEFFWKILLLHSKTQIFCANRRS